MNRSIEGVENVWYGTLEYIDNWRPCNSIIFIWQHGIKLHRPRKRLKTPDGFFTRAQVFSLPSSTLLEDHYDNTVWDRRFCVSRSLLLIPSIHNNNNIYNKYLKIIYRYQNLLVSIRTGSWVISSHTEITSHQKPHRFWMQTCAHQAV